MRVFMYRAHHEQALSKYEDIWASYHAKYEGFAKAQELQKKFEELQLVDEQRMLRNHLVVAI